MALELPEPSSDTALPVDLDASGVPPLPFDLDPLGIAPLPPIVPYALYRHPSRSTVRGFQYLRNVGGRADAAALLRKALQTRGRLPDGLEAVATAMFTGSRGFIEPLPGQWALALDDRFLKAWYSGNFVVFDLETTGGKPPTERITEIGAVKIANGQMVAEFQTLVNPGKAIPPFVARLTGITNKMVRRAPKIEKVLPKFLDFLADSIPIAHDVFQDLRFIDQSLTNLYDGVLALPVLDTLVMAKDLVPPEVGYSLKKVAEYLGIDASSSHRALDDARVTAQVFLAYLERRGGLTGVRWLLDGYVFQPAEVDEPLDPNEDEDLGL
ncbi:MAG: exonuclease domain-containing protein [bacterium]